jgi:hypothetical protein
MIIPRADQLTDVRVAIEFAVKLCTPQRTLAISQEAPNKKIETVGCASVCCDIKRHTLTQLVCLTTGAGAQDISSISIVFRPLG